MMRISIETLGTRGDVQPYLALANRLQAKGHDVQLAGPMQFADMAAGRGVPYASLPSEFLALLDTPEGKASMAGGKGLGAGFKLLEHVRPMMRRLLEVEWRVVRDYRPDMIVSHPKSIAAPHIAQALGIPHVLASPLPGFTPTRAFPSPLMPFESLGPLNRMSHLFAMRGGDMLFGRMLRAWRSETLALPAKAPRTEPVRTIYAYSRHLLPVPKDYGNDVLVSGYWFVDTTDWLMPDALRGFLQAGDKPVYVGFGSMPGHDPEQLGSIVIEALSKAGKRGVLATGSGAIKVKAAPPHVHVIDAAPHDRLFHHVSATVHHGGAGTTGASMRAGLPTVLCPFFGDQPFWARQVVKLGIGPTPLDRKNLTVEGLAAALAATNEPAMRRRAKELGGRVLAEDGLGAAVEFLERTSGTWRREPHRRSLVVNPA
jgi:UDP:flavonoid glycosyltransferase YjiC (YdhE family)